MTYTKEQYNIALQITKDLKLSGVQLYVDELSGEIQTKSSSLRKLSEEEINAIEQ